MRELVMAPPNVSEYPAVAISMGLSKGRHAQVSHSSLGGAVQLLPRSVSVISLTALSRLPDDCFYSVGVGGPDLLLVRQISDWSALVFGLAMRECASVRLLSATCHGGLLYRRPEPVREERSARREGENEWVVVVAGVGFEPTTSGL